ncbi:MAG: hypothetical protein AB7I27_08080 [Bacteriovoracaceae bacterium]
MEQSFRQILHSSIQALDGEDGSLDDLLFDDNKWFIRYLVIKTKGLLKHDRVVISPTGVDEIDWKNKKIKIYLTKNKIITAPKIDSAEPVFKQMEKKFFDFYNWPYYWDDMGVWGIDPRSTVSLVDKDILPPKGDPHLRSCRIVGHYNVELEGKRIGEVEDILIEEKDLTIKSFLITSGHWPRIHHSTISVNSIDSIHWATRSIRLRPSVKDFESQSSIIL